MTLAFVLWSLIAIAVGSVLGYWRGVFSSGVHLACREAQRRIDLVKALSFPTRLAFCPICQQKSHWVLKEDPNGSYYYGEAWCDSCEVRVVLMRSTIGIGLDPLKPKPPPSQYDRVTKAGVAPVQGDIFEQGHPTDAVNPYQGDGGPAINTIRDPAGAMALYEHLTKPGPLDLTRRVSSPNSAEAEVRRFYPNFTRPE